MVDQQRHRPKLERMTNNTNERTWARGKGLDFLKPIYRLDQMAFDWGSYNACGEGEDQGSGVVCKLSLLNLTAKGRLRTVDSKICLGLTTDTIFAMSAYGMVSEMSQEH